MVDSIRKTSHVRVITPPGRLRNVDRRDQSDQDAREKRDEPSEDNQEESNANDHHRRHTDDEGIRQHDLKTNDLNPNLTGHRINLRI